MEGKNMCLVADIELGEFLKNSGCETAHHRMCLQENKCGFALQGICCRLCSNGPCRITEKAPLGVCGASADIIAAKGFLRAVAAGAASYLHLTENVAEKLLEMAKNRIQLQGEHVLTDVFGFKNDLYESAQQVASAVLSDLNCPVKEKMVLWKALAGNKRKQVWENLGIIPGGAKGEVLEALVKTGTNLNADPTDMLLHCLRLGIATGYYGLTLTNLLNDVMFGEPSIHESPAGFGIIDPKCVNILIVGHQAHMYQELMSVIESPKGIRLARDAGADRIVLVGSTCVGQDLRMRCDTCGAFCGNAGNNFATEAILLTGCIDLVLTEFNCTLPGLDNICKANEIPQICLDPVAKTINASMDSGIDRILDTALKSYGKQINKPSRSNPMQKHRQTGLTGVTDKSLKGFLGGSWKPLIDLIAGGAIKGIAGVVGCSNLRTMGHDVHLIQLTQELLKKDILVLAAGCTSGAMANLGLTSREAAAMAGRNLRLVCDTLGIPPVMDMGPCLGIGRMESVASEIAEELGIDLPQLPLVISAPQWLEEQALADGAFALALGLPLHLGSAPFVTGSPLIVDVLTRQIQDLTGGQLIIEENPQRAADLLSDLILEKRKALQLV